MVQHYWLVCCLRYITIPYILFCKRDWSYSHPWVIPTELLPHPASVQFIVPAQVKYLFCQVVFCFFPSILCYFSLLHTRFSWFLKLFFISNLPPVLLSTGNLTSSSSRFNNHLFYLLSSTVSGTHPPEILPIWWQTTDKYSEFHFHLSAPIVLLSSFKTLLWLTEHISDSEMAYMISWGPSPPCITYSSMMVLYKMLFRERWYKGVMIQGSYPEVFRRWWIQREVPLS